MEKSLPNLKRTLRNLKKLEIKIRFGNSQIDVNKINLIWDKYFSTSKKDKNIKYNMEKLLSLRKEEFKEVISEYYYNVYFMYYKENGIMGLNLYDTQLLSYMGLSPTAGIKEVKKRFRELAHKYHPDKGGDHLKFIELMENYKKLIE